MHTHTHAHTQTRTRTHARTRTHTHTHTHTRTHTHTHNTHTHTHTHIYIYIYKTRFKNSTEKHDWIEDMTVPSLQKVFSKGRGEQSNGKCGKQCRELVVWEARFVSSELKTLLTIADTTDRRRVGAVLAARPTLEMVKDVVLIHCFGRLSKLWIKRLLGSFNMHCSVYFQL